MLGNRASGADEVTDLLRNLISDQAGALTSRSWLLRLVEAGTVRQEAPL